MQQAPATSTPPAISTRPSGNSVAVCPLSRDRHAAGRRERTGGRIEELRTGRLTSGDEYLAVLQQRRGLPRRGATMLPVAVNVPAVGS